MTETSLTSQKICDSVRKELSKAQVNFLDYCLHFSYGKLEVEIKDGQPVGARIIVKENVLQQYHKFD